MSKSPSNLRINGDRLWDSLMEMTKIGPAYECKRQNMWFFNSALLH